MRRYKQTNSQKCFEVKHLSLKKLLKNCTESTIKVTMQK